MDAKPRDLEVKDRLRRFRISRKEARERQLWLRLINTGGSAALDAKRALLRQEARELKLIFHAIVQKLERFLRRGFARVLADLFVI